MRKVFGALLAFSALGSAAMASPLALTGNYLEVGISDYGTFGSNGGTPPGILHDPTGTGNFCPGGVCNDYLTPGTPHDGFAINSAQTGFIVNDNRGVGSFGTASPTTTTVPGYSLAATWSGGTAQVAVTNTYYFNPGDQIIHVKTTLTALTDLTSLSFGRSEDPDPDVNAYSTFLTYNTRGDATHAPEDLVSSAGVISGLVLGILNESGNTYAHNSGISGSCCSNDDPNNVVSGYGAIYPAVATGDYGLQMAWMIGDLAAGSSATISYAYVFGDHQDTVGSAGVPEPATLGVLGAALAGLAAVRRRR